MLAVYRYSTGGGSIPALGNGKVTARAKRGHGGARNRRDRESEFLTRQQCEKLLAAARKAAGSGLAFNRHWCVHYESAAIAERQGARFIGRLLKLLSDYVRRTAGPGQFAAIWVRESGDGKGGHVHILMRTPPDCSLAGRTRKWVRLAGGDYRKGVSRVHTIGASLKAAETQGAHYRANAAAVLAYVLKGAAIGAGRALGLERCGEGGLIIGKRCGFTQNISPGKAVARELSVAPTRARFPESRIAARAG